MRPTNDASRICYCLDPPASRFRKFQIKSLRLKIIKLYLNGFKFPPF